MESDVKVKSLTFKSSSSGIYSVQCQLSNWMKSPVFQKNYDDGKHVKQATIEFENSDHVREVKATHQNSDSLSRVSSIEFLDANRSHLLAYDPYNRKDKT